MAETTLAGLMQRVQSEFGYGERKPGAKSVRFDEVSLEKLEKEKKIGIQAVEQIIETASVSSEETDDASIFHSPANDPDLVRWQFRIAVDNNDPEFMEKVLRFERERVRVGETEFEIPIEDKAKQLALSMISGREEMYHVLAQYVLISSADEWLYSTHPSSRCTCEDGHVGSLLIRLVRAGQTAMATRALKGGLNPNATLCDGEMERMYWNTEDHDGRRENAKLDAHFRKETPLTAAAAIGDVRMLDLLLDYGADPESFDYAVFAVAARFGHINILQALLANELFDDFRKMDRGCVIALKAASMENQTKTIDWLLLRLQQFDDWELQSQPRKTSVTATVGRALSRKSASLGSLRSKSARIYKRTKSFNFYSAGQSSASLPSSSSSSMRRTTSASSMSSSGSTRSRRTSASKQLVGEALSTAFDELIKDGKRPGSVLRQSLVQGIENVVRLQRQHSTASEFDPRKLLAFYVSASTDENVFTPEHVAQRLLSMGLRDFLVGEKKIEVPLSKSVESDEPKRMSNRSLGSVSEALSSTMSLTATPPDSTRARLKALTVVTARTLRNMFFSKLQAASTRFLPVGVTSGYEASKVASEKERQSVVFSAAQVGHMGVLTHLMSVCSDSMLKKLLEIAATYHQKEVVQFLLEQAADRKMQQLSSTSLNDEQDEQEFSIENPRFIDGELLGHTLMAALSVGDVEIASLMLEKGAKLSRENITTVFEKIVTRSEKTSVSAVAKLMELALDTDFGAEDLAHIFSVGLEADPFNYRSMKTVLNHSRCTFITLDHLMRLVERSCGRSHEDTWRSMAEAMIKNMLRSDNHGQVNKDLNSLLTEAETLPQVHVGVLTVIMHSCELDDPDTDQESGATPSRWL